MLKLNDTVYDILNWTTRLLLPGLASLYALLASTWGLPFVEEIPETVLGVQLFLGTILGISTAEFYKQKTL